jgi:hypothetical protein
MSLESEKTGSVIGVFHSYKSKSSVACESRSRKRWLGLGGLCGLVVSTFVLVMPLGALATDQKPAVRVAEMLDAWKVDLVRGEKLGASARYPSPTQAILARHLKQFEKKYKFMVVRIQTVQKCQTAPIVVTRWPIRASTISTSRARLVSKLLTDLIPPWSYEGAFVEAITKDDVPFAVYFSSNRGHLVTGAWSDSVRAPR